MRGKKKTKNTMRNLSIVSAVLLLAILGGIIYKTQFFEASTEKVEEQEVNDAMQNEEPKEDSSTVEGSVSNAETSKEDEENNTENSEVSEEENPSNSNSNASSNSNGETAETKPSANSGVTYNENQQTPVEPTYINGILLVNKKYPLPQTYNYGEDSVAKEALQTMLAAGKEAGFVYEAFSGYRSYEYQANLYNRYVKRDGKEKADRYSARPGHSEHQSGLAFDIGEANNKDLWLTEAFGETEAGKWLMDNAHHYGFILRYPKGKEHITGYMYESWHYRYVGVEHATKIYEANVTLEEYLGVN